MSMFNRWCLDEDPAGWRDGEKVAKHRNAHLSLAAVAALGSVASAVGANRAASVREKQLAFERGFDKKATVFKIPHGENASSTMDRLRRLLGKPAIAKK